MSYGVACNSCAYCVRLNNRFRDSLITLEQYEVQVAIHEPSCCAEFADYSSVHLESAIAPKVISDALERGIVFTGIVSDGDNKTHDVHDSLESTTIWTNIKISTASSVSLMSRSERR